MQQVDEDEEAREKLRKYNREWRANNLDRSREHSRKYKRKWRTENPEEAHEYKLKYLYGITLDDYHKLVADAGGRCNICRIDNPGKNRKRWCVDHDKDTGVVGGILCVKCNVGGGNFDHDPERLRKAADYFERRKLSYFKE